MAVILVKHMLFAVMIASGPMGAVPFPTADTKGKNRRSNCSTEVPFLVVSSMNGNCTDDRVGHQHHGRQKEVTSRDLARIRTSWRQTFEEIKSLVVPTSAKQDSLANLDAILAFCPHGIFPFAFGVGAITDYAQQIFGRAEPRGAV